ncbi:MAG: hypothetical protein QOE90_1295 [Thermoplasmata archaeon]|nr:hypothetical protein [Thermoplasmata archaeon]
MGLKPAPTFPISLDARRAAEVLDRTLRSYGADVTVETRAGTVRYLRSGRPFALARVLASRVDVAFRKVGRADHKRILDARAAGLPFLPHRVVLEAPGDLDSQLLAWLRESYEWVEEWERLA